jgi:hypothetical protein
LAATSELENAGFEISHLSDSKTNFEIQENFQSLMSNDSLQQYKNSIIDKLL